jgi:hypothetical protein
MFLIIAFKKSFKNVTMVTFPLTFWLGTQIWNMIWEFSWEFFPFKVIWKSFYF